MKIPPWIAEFECTHSDPIDFDLERTDRPEKLIYHFTQQRRSPHMKIQAIDRQGFCAILITEGQAVFEHLGKTAQLQRGSVLLRRYNQPYRFCKTDPDELALTMICFYPSIEPLWNRLFKPDCIAVHPFNRTKFIELTDTVFTLLCRNPERRIERATTFTPFFLETVAAENLQTEKFQDPKRKLAENCLHYLHENFRRIRSMDEAARNCHVSRGHLYTLFQTHFQVTPKEYLERLKINTATDLLMQTDSTMERIAEETGYADAPTFSKAFKRRNGVSPAEWRRQTRTFAH